MTKYLFCIPKLRHLSIDCLVGNPNTDIRIAPFDKDYKHVSKTLILYNLRVT